MGAESARPWPVMQAIVTRPAPFEEGGIKMTIIERLQQSVDSSRLPGHDPDSGTVDIADLAALLACVKAQHTWIHRPIFNETTDKFLVGEFEKDRATRIRTRRGPKESGAEMTIWDKIFVWFCMTAILGSVVYVLVKISIEP
jgi:hypothetical protein